MHADAISGWNEKRDSVDKFLSKEVNSVVCIIVRAPLIVLENEYNAHLEIIQWEVPVWLVISRFVRIRKG